MLQQIVTLYNSMSEEQFIEMIKQSGQDPEAILPYIKEIVSKGDITDAP